jgi:hypothetical protein
MEEKMENVNASPNTATAKKLGFTNCFFTLFSLGTIVSGAWACLLCMGIGVSLVLVGTILFAELGF